ASTLILLLVFPLKPATRGISYSTPGTQKNQHGSCTFHLRGKAPHKSGASSLTSEAYSQGFLPRNLQDGIWSITYQPEAWRSSYEAMHAPCHQWRVDIAHQLSPLIQVLPLGDYTSSPRKLGVTRTETCYGTQLQLPQKKKYSPLGENELPLNTFLESNNSTASLLIQTCTPTRFKLSLE
ncbi:hypothetical protein DSO57_1021875, partial [Entomophthora muscae]